jgi:cobalt transporter subunit CbtA
MIGRVLLAALLAGIVSGIIMGAIQHVRLTPFILAAEVYENGGASHDHATVATAETTIAADPAPEEEKEEEWAPADGLERTFYTTVATAMAGAAFAAMLAGISLLAGIPITPRNGVIWGLCGFLAVSLAPAAGLPPELPGMPAGDLAMRQAWWAGTIAATGAGLYLIATRRELWAIAVAVIVMALPHVIGAPVAATHETAVPAGLAAAFAANTIAAAAVFWCLIGVFLGLAIDRFAKEVHAT